jgi:hypothetical protein
MALVLRLRNVNGIGTPGAISVDLSDGWEILNKFMTIQ